MSTKKKYYLEVNARSEKSSRLRNGVGSSKKSLKFYLLNTSFISLTACNSKKIKEPIENSNLITIGQADNIVQSAGVELVNDNEIFSIGDINNSQSIGGQIVTTDNESGFENTPGEDDDTKKSEQPYVYVPANDTLIITATTDYSDRSIGSFDGIAEIRFAAANKTGTFTGNQLASRYIGLTETAGGISNLIINVSSETLIDFENLNATTFTSGSDTLTINGMNGNQQITAPDIASTINSGSGDDIIVAGVLNDIIDGGDGNDILDGGSGVNTLSYNSASAGVSVDLSNSAQQNTIGSGSDTLSNFSNLTGSNFNDQLSGNANANVINAGAGDDTLTGGDGADALTGGNGDDIYFFNTSDVDSGESITEVIGGGTDTVAIVTSTDFSSMTIASLNEIEEIRFAGVSKTGTFTGAQLTGETLTLTETVAGTSNLIINVGSGITVTFTNMSASTFTSGSDTITINGASGNEDVTGPNLASTIVGGEGNDTILAGTANDTVDGGTGNDNLNGGSGTNTVSYSTASGGVTVDLANSAQQNTFGAGLDTISNFINLSGSSFDDTLTGTVNSNNIDAGNGNDIISGGDGADSLTGGLGNDVYRFNTNEVDNGEYITEVDGGGTDTVAIVTSTDFVNMPATSFDEIEEIRFSGSNQTGTFTGTQLTGETINLTETAAGTSTLVINLASGTTSDFTNITASTFTSGSDSIIINGTGGNETISSTNLASTVNAGIGNDTITGGGGADTLVGGNGDDLYRFNTNDVDSGESITELSSEGSDAVAIVTSTDLSNMTAASFNEIEEIRFTGANQTATFTGSQLTGETLNLTETAAGTSNLIINVGSGTTATFTNITASTFTSGADTVTINGAGGNETIVSVDFASTLNGGDGADSLTGGDGDDVYLFNTNDVDSGESITELSGEGTDAVAIITSTDLSNMTAASFDEIEEIRFAGSDKTGTFTGAQLTGETLNLTETAAGTSNLIINVGSGTTATFTNITASTFTSGSDTITINGVGGNENITGPNLISTFNGGAGNDTIVAGTANDIINGNDNNDTIDGGDGADSLVGGDGDDVYLFDTNDIDTGESITELSGEGTDAIGIVTSTDFINMPIASFNEIEEIRFAGSNKTGTFTGAQLTGETLSLTETAAGTSNLIINVASGTTATFANMTASTFTSGSDTITINGVGGNENITGPNVTSTINGYAGADTIVGGSANDTINGGDGADNLTGGDGDDSLTGGDSDDTLVGGLANDTIDGGDGADSLTGGSGDDIYLFDTNDVDSGESITEGAGGGTDTVVIRTSTNFVNMPVASFNEIEEIRFGGSSKTGTFTGAQLTGETLSLTETASGTSNLIINVASGTTVTFANMTASTFTSGSDTITINGAGGNENITGPNVASTINAGLGADNIAGGNKNDIINGGGGSDSITGGQGSDTINSGGGGDTITGGRGSDIINLNASSETDTVKLQGSSSGSYNGDVISNFEVGNDLLDMISNNARMNGNSTSSFNSGTTIDDNTAFIREGTNVSEGASATLAQATANISVGTFDDAGGNNDRVYIAWDDGTHSYIGLITADQNDDGFTGDSLALICTLSGLSDCTTLTASNFSDFT